MMKPGFAGRWFDADGQPIELKAALQIELVPRAKWRRRLREAASQAPPPPTAA